MIGGFLLALFAFIYIDLKDKEKRRKTYEDFEGFCNKKKTNGALEYERACKALDEIESAMKLGEKLQDICIKNNIEITNYPNAAAIYIARKAMEQDGFIPCLTVNFPIDRNRGAPYIMRMLESSESSAKTCYILSYKGYGKK